MYIFEELCAYFKATQLLTNISVAHQNNVLQSPFIKKEKFTMPMFQISGLLSVLFPWHVAPSVSIVRAVLEKFLLQFFWSTTKQQPDHYSHNLTSGQFRKFFWEKVALLRSVVQKWTAIIMVCLTQSSRMMQSGAK